MGYADPAGRDQPLDTLRGLAAVSVVIWHSMLGFFPAAPGVLPGFRIEDSLIGTPIYGLCNGTAAVVVFFVLSGFVLTRKAIAEENIGILSRHALRRWPRLAFLATAATFISWLCMRLNLYSYVEAGAITGSPWLQSFAYGSAQPIEPNLGLALAQGSFWTFFRGDAFYDTSLWTMHFEFYGSFAAFGLAALLINTRSKALRLIMVSLALLLAYHTDTPWYVAFPLGVGLAALPRRPHLPLPISLALVALAIWMFGFTGAPVGVQKPMFQIFHNISPQYVWMLGASIIILSLDATTPLGMLLSGRIGRFLGWISFPLYVVHVLVLCSLGCWVYLELNRIHPGATSAAGAIVATVAASLLLSVPLAQANDMWLRAIAFIGTRATRREEEYKLSSGTNSEYHPECSTDSRKISD